MMVKRGLDMVLLNMIIANKWHIWGQKAWKIVASFKFSLMDYSWLGEALLIFTGICIWRGSQAGRQISPFSSCSTFQTAQSHKLIQWVQASRRGSYRVHSPRKISRQISPKRTPWGRGTARWIDYVYDMTLAGPKGGARRKRHFELLPAANGDWNVMTSVLKKKKKEKSFPN